MKIHHREKSVVRVLAGRPRDTMILGPGRRLGEVSRVLILSSTFLQIKMPTSIWF